MGQTREAEENYGQLLSNFPTSYYSQLVSGPGAAAVVPEGTLSHSARTGPSPPFWR